MRCGQDKSIIVAGTGPVGLTAALALAEIGRRVVLVGPSPRTDDRRTTALMRPALQYLESLGVLEALEAFSAPLAVMRVVDGTKRLVRSGTVTFRAVEIDAPYFGLNIPNSHLNEALADRVWGHSLVEWRETTVERWQTHADGITAELADRSKFSGPLAVAADGRNSLARQAAGIAARTKKLPQSALVLNFGHSRRHADTSTEFHTENGPCTQVPLPGGLRSSLVWVTSPAQAETLAALDDASLSVKLEERLQSMLGKVTVEPGHQIYPLAALTPARFAARRVMLVGEAAHVFPPITAQGLNLGMRDIVDLVAVVGEHGSDPGSTMALVQYDARRRPDTVARSAAVNMLNASLLSSLLPAQLARSGTLGALRSFAPLRGFFMREGMSPGSGFRALLPGALRRP
ncbi:UbiH/UbiF family hydroxylase [Nitratireductor luteus]|uniref:UbiH/UbiF family hydroxylase n=1 Tax=Nitratireductor luteus TaxID=2976980 RepID=UPI002240C34D|nr:UbiH/UbiF family hydroxylase [Nitratireductor luteus]